MDIFRAYRYNNCHCLQKINTCDNAIEKNNFLLIKSGNIYICLLKGFQWSGQAFCHLAFYLKRWDFYLEFFEVEETTKSCERRHMSTNFIKSNFSRLVLGQNPFKYSNLHCGQMYISPTMKLQQSPVRINFQPQCGKTKYFDIDHLWTYHCH